MPRAASIVLALLLLGGSAALVPTATAAHTYRDVTIRSFDDTMLAATLFVPSGADRNAPVPFILMTHGWAGKRVAEPTGRVLDLLNAGYGVLTWDSRGFGASTGEVMLDSPAYEGRDVSAILDYLARAVPAALKDGPGDPRVGMSGGSYAGGIQLLAAAHDDRIDVIAPEITWHDLNEALAPNGVPKLYWTSLLFGSGLEASCLNARNNDPQGALTHSALPVRTASTGCQTPLLAQWYAQVHATGTVPEDVRAELAFRSPATYIENVTVPTLLVQGYPDTLFDVGQAIANYEAIKENGAPVKLWLYDGGHSRPEMASLVPNTQGALISPLVIKWMDRHLKGITSVDTGPKVEYFADGVWHSAPTIPFVHAGADQTDTIAGVPALVQGPVVPGSQGSATYALQRGPAVVGGTASLSFFATGIGREGFVFASLGKQNLTTGAVTRLGDQVQPVRFAYSVETGRIDVDLVPVATQLGGDDQLVLTVASSDPLYDGPRAPGFVNLEDLVIRWQNAQ